MGLEPFEINDKGIIEETIHSGPVETYNKAIDLKKFYKDFYSHIDGAPNISFHDFLGESPSISTGGFIGEEAPGFTKVDNDQELNRTGNMFEKKFRWATKTNGSVEFEMVWMFRADTKLPVGWAEIKIELVNRNMQDQEFLVGNEKKVLQTGTWEFRNEIKYKNKIIPAYLNTIPFIKNHEFLKKQLLHHMYRKGIEDDVDFVAEKVKPYIFGFLRERFG